MPLDLRGFYPQNNPNQSLYKISDTIEQNTRYKQEKEHREQKEKEADDYKKYTLLKNTIDPEDVATGNASADDYFNQETKKVFDEIITDPNLGKMSYADLYGTIQRKWQPLVQSAGKIKNGLAQIDATVKAAGQEDTNLATEKLAPAAKLKFIDEIMPIGEGGKRTYNTAGFNPDKNHVLDILDSDDYWRYMKGADPLIKYIENHKTEDVSLERRLGDQSIIPYKGKQSPFSTLNITPGQYGVITSAEEPKFDIATEDDVITENGQSIPVKLLRKDIYKNHIEDIPANKRALDFLWNNYKERNGIVSKNATEEEKRKRAFAVGVFKAHDPSQIPRGTSQHLPRNTTNNYVNTGGGKDAGAEWVKRAVGAMEKGDKQGMEDVFSELLAGDMKELKGVEDLGGGKVKVTVMPNPKYDMVGQLIQESTKPVERVFDINDRQLPYRLANLRQTIMGGDVKLERTRFDRPKADTPKQEGGMVTVILKDGRKGQIPSDKVAQFLKDNPGAKKQ